MPGRADYREYTSEIMALGCDRCGVPALRRCVTRLGQDKSPCPERKVKATISVQAAAAEVRGKISAYEDIRDLMIQARDTAEPYSDLRALEASIRTADDKIRLLRDGRGGNSYGEVYGEGPGEPAS